MAEAGSSSPPVPPNPTGSWPVPYPHGRSEVEVRLEHLEKQSAEIRGSIAELKSDVDDKLVDLTPKRTAPATLVALGFSIAMGAGGLVWSLNSQISAKADARSVIEAIDRHSTSPHPGTSVRLEEHERRMIKLERDLDWLKDTMYGVARKAGVNPTPPPAPNQPSP